MLFHSAVFAFVFLPIALLGFYLVGLGRHRGMSAAWLLVASLVFYAWWRLPDLGILLGSMLFNWVGGELLRRPGLGRARRWLLALGVAANLALLGYFKYFGFLAQTANDVLGTRLPAVAIVLPLAVSFFTFTQIAYLVDASRGKTSSYSFLDYCLFVTFFPHLIAGPITHYWQLLPQIRNVSFRPRHQDLAPGLTIFAFGLGEKVLVADFVALYASPMFGAAATRPPSLLEAWGGVLAYTLQIYFDFAGYSDMAIGLARMFGFKLPLNFDSPYKSASIIDFWRRWHITLSTFLREYLYFSLGGNRKGPVRRYANLMITMLLGGLWHGAGWTFVIWGGLHGVYLIVNHVWRSVKPRAELSPRLSRLGNLASVGLTFLCVMVAWVFFRASNLAAAGSVLRGMAGLNGVVLPFELEGLLGPVGDWLTRAGVAYGALPSIGGLRDGLWFGAALAAILAVAWLAPNTQEIMALAEPALDASPRPGHLLWRPSVRAGLAIGALLFAVGLRSVTAPAGEFLYFNF